MLKAIREGKVASIYGTRKGLLKGKGFIAMGEVGGVGATHLRSEVGACVEQY